MESDGRTRSYDVTVSVLREIGGVVEMWDYFDLKITGLHSLPGVLAPAMAERYGQEWAPESDRLWKRKLRVLRNSLSYHDGERGTCALPSKLGADKITLRLKVCRESQ